jgi:hypothetical protein
MREHDEDVFERDLTRREEFSGKVGHVRTREERGMAGRRTVTPRVVPLLGSAAGSAALASGCSGAADGANEVVDSAVTAGAVDMRGGSLARNMGCTTQCRGRISSTSSRVAPSVSLC